jgi:hypothetical protein
MRKTLLNGAQRRRFPGRASKKPTRPAGQHQATESGRANLVAASFILGRLASRRIDMRAYIAALVVTAWFVDFGQRFFNAIGFSTASDTDFG